MSLYQRLIYGGAPKQKFSILVVLAILSILLGACNRGSTPTPDAPAIPTLRLPDPQVFVTNIPSPRMAAQVFLDAWKAENYPQMYALLTDAARAVVTEEQFTQRYTDVANEAALSELNYTITNQEKNGAEANVQFDVTLTSSIIGPIQRSNSLKLMQEAGAWKVAWSDDAILPDLAGGNYLRMDSPTMTRQAIYDRNGNILAAQTKAAAIGVWPDYVDLGSDGGLISVLSTLSGIRGDRIRGWIEQADFGAYLPIAEVPVDEDSGRLDALRGWGSAVVSEYSRRLYYGNGIGPHVIGYVSPIQADEAGAYRRKGYRVDDRVGRKGLELWGEDILMGKRGGTLYVFNKDGAPVSELGKAAGQPGQEITTTLERDFQAEVQKAMSVFNGAIVVMELNTGRVLAMASSPGFDPNAYEIENYNWNTQISEIVNNPSLPQFNRATQGQYPLGSVFKIITLAAALESGRFTRDSSYNCQYEFNELAGVTLYDWTWDHFQEDGETLPSGELNLLEGLIRSCNPWFWHIGRDLYDAGLTSAIHDMSLGFGLGERTGIDGLDEEPGNIPTPASQLDATNLAIGQGEMLVTPLQVARFIAAVGNGGTLYRPQVIEKIGLPNGETTRTFKPEVVGKLPIKPETLAMIQEAMKGVVSSKSPVGTAVRPMSGLDIPIAGKTGTAEAPAGDSHAWFAGYTFANYPNKPDIAIAVLAENAGEGSEIAAPIFRRVVELWFYGAPKRLYRWESNFDVTREPTEPVTETPTQMPGFINP